MADITLYHNPRCSKSRAALDLLQERGVDLEVVEYLKTPPGRAGLEALARKLGREPSEWVRTGESAYAESGLSGSSSRDEILSAMDAHPVLMERPIAVKGERAIVGRPPEQVLELL